MMLLGITVRPVVYMRCVNRTLAKNNLFSFHRVSFTDSLFSRIKSYSSRRGLNTANNNGQARYGQYGLFCNKFPLFRPRRTVSGQPLPAPKNTNSIRAENSLKSKDVKSPKKSIPDSSALYRLIALAKPEKWRLIGNN